MPNRMDLLAQAWEDRDGPAILGTVDESGLPNVIYVADMRFEAGTGLIIVDNYFQKTRKNILSGSRGSVLFMTKEKKAYQAKGTLEYHTDGPVFDAMRVWHMQQHPGHAAVVLHLEALFSGAQELT